MGDSLSLMARDRNKVHLATVTAHWERAGSQGNDRR